MDALALSELDSPFKSDFSLRFKLALVTDKVDTDILGCMLFDLLQPDAEVVESLITCDIICQEHTVSTSVENPSHRLERFLTGRVPNLEFDDFIVNPDTVRSELNSNSDLMLLLKLVVHDSLHETTLTNPSVPNNDQLEKMVLTWNCFILFRQNFKWDCLDLVQ